MDYCSSCRRHLNGALVCPGCGAYAPDIAPATIDSRVTAPSRPVGTRTGSVMVPPPAATWEYEGLGGGWQGGSAADGFGAQGPAVGGSAAEAAVIGFGEHGATRPRRLRTEGPGTMAPPAEASGVGDADADVDMDMDMDLCVDVEGVPVPPQGRAARRRQLARWKKNQRRAVVATAVALVGGGLTVLGMDRQSSDHTQAATAPDAENLGSVKEQGSQRGRAPATETDDARRTADAPTTWTPSGDTSRDRSAGDRPDSRAGHPNSPHTASATPSAKQARTGSSTSGGTATDTDTPTDESTTPPATDDSGSAADTGTGTGTNTGSGSGTGTGADSGSGTDTGSDAGTDTGTSDGSSSDTATTSPSGLCLLGIVCVS